MTAEDVLPEKGLLERTATIKIFEYSPLDSKLKKQTDIVKVQCKLFKDQVNVGNGEIRDMCIMIILEMNSMISLIIFLRTD